MADAIDRALGTGAFGDINRPGLSRDELEAPAKAKPAPTPTPPAAEEDN